MNWDRIEGNWKQIKGNINQQWGKLCGNPLDVSLGKRIQLAGRIQEICGISKDEARKPNAYWASRQKNQPQSGEA